MKIYKIRLRKSLGILVAALVMLFTYMGNAYAADDMTFFGFTLGKEFSYPSCQGPRTEICTSTGKIVPTPSGISVKVRTMAFPRNLVPDWIVIEDADLETFEPENVIESIIIHTDIPSEAIGEKGINAIYEHLVARLGRESKRTLMNVLGQRYHYVAIWKRPWGMVTFATATSTTHGVLPLISIASNKYLEMWEKNKSVQQERAARTEAKKLKF